MSARSGLVRVDDFVGVAREVDGQIVAAAGYDHHQESSCCLHLAVEPRGLNRAFIYKLFSVPFQQWKYNCLIGIIQRGNVQSANIARHLGFTQFAELPGAHPSGSLDFYRIYADECKWLKRLQK